MLPALCFAPTTPPIVPPLLTLNCPLTNAFVKLAVSLSSPTIPPTLVAFSTSILPLYETWSTLEDCFNVETMPPTITPLCSLLTIKFK